MDVAQAQVELDRDLAHDLVLEPEVPLSHLPELLEAEVLDLLFGFEVPEV